MQNDDHQSRFLEAPFVRMLRMRSASLKMRVISVLRSFTRQQADSKRKNKLVFFLPLAKPVESFLAFWRWTYHNSRQWVWCCWGRGHPRGCPDRPHFRFRHPRGRPHPHPPRRGNLDSGHENPMTSPTSLTTRVWKKRCCDLSVGSTATKN